MKIILGLVLLCGMFSAASGNTPIEKFVPVLDPPQPPPRFYLGLTGGYGRTFHTAGIVNPFLKDHDFENLQPNTLFIGVSAEYFLRWIDRPDALGSLVFKTYYRNYLSASTSFSQTEEKNSGSQSQTVETQYSTIYKSSFINTEVLYSSYLSLSSLFSISAGPGVSFLINEDLSKRAEILHPSDFTFDENSFEGNYQLEQNGRAAVFKNDKSSHLQVYLKAGVQYNIMFGQKNQFQLVPSASFNFGITKLYGAENFRFITIDFGVDFRTAL